MGETKMRVAHLSRTEIINNVLKGKKELGSSTGFLDNITGMCLGTENYQIFGEIKKERELIFKYLPLGNF